MANATPQIDITSFKKMLLRCTQKITEYEKESFTLSRGRNQATCTEIGSLLNDLISAASHAVASTAPNLAPADSIRLAEVLPVLQNMQKDLNAILGSTSEASQPLSAKFSELVELGFQVTSSGELSDEYTLEAPAMQTTRLADGTVAVYNAHEKRTPEFLKWWTDKFSPTWMERSSDQLTPSQLAFFRILTRPVDSPDLLLSTKRAKSRSSESAKIASANLDAVKAAANQLLKNIESDEREDAAWSLYLDICESWTVITLNNTHRKFSATDFAEFYERAAVYVASNYDGSRGSKLKIFVEFANWANQALWREKSQLFEAPWIEEKANKNRESLLCGIPQSKLPQLPNYSSPMFMNVAKFTHVDKQSTCPRLRGCWAPEQCNSTLYSLVWQMEQVFSPFSTRNLFPLLTHSTELSYFSDDCILRPPALLQYIQEVGHLDMDNVLSRTSDLPDAQLSKMWKAFTEQVLSHPTSDLNQFIQTHY